MPSLESKGWRYLEKRFGIERDDLEGLDLRERSGDLWLVPKELDTELKIQTHGIRMIRKLDIGLKPTTYGLQLLEDQIERNIVELDRKEAVKLLRREEMIDRDLEKEGYTALKFEDRILGCGMYKDGVVSSRVPKGRGKESADIIEN